jgi:hypothetical protein
VVKLDSYKINLKIVNIFLLFFLVLSFYVFSQNSRSDYHNRQESSRAYQEEPGDEYLIKVNPYLQQAKDEKKLRERVGGATIQTGKVVLIVGGIAILLGIYIMQSR